LTAKDLIKRLGHCSSACVRIKSSRKKNYRAGSALPEPPMRASRLAVNAFRSTRVERPCGKLCRATAGTGVRAKVVDDLALPDRQRCSRQIQCLHKFHCTDCAAGHVCGEVLTLAENSGTSCRSSENSRDFGTARSRNGTRPPSAAHRRRRRSRPVHSVVQDSASHPAGPLARPATSPGSASSIAE